ncbi:MAG TPA: aspartyl/asparaginyl beta-hydroxylase domain-containing protein [Rhizomicrobium sp.]|jgi:aspartyl/asparaginyl beta-hydroxylase (cupin superfamily)|nr:aspartyl/asparaginyl beta-hydroxylase domain-containing protein [Rhizomicrobium sp.]
MTDEVRVRGIVETAGAAMRAGRADEAARLWGEVLALSPEHPQALFHAGQHALLRKDYARARALLERAQRAAPQEPAIPLNLSFVHRATGDAAAELAALTAALAIDPYFYPALLGKALAVERSGDKRQAARIFRDVLRIAPPPDQAPPEIREKLVHARGLVEENAAALATELARRTAPVRARHAHENLERYDECEAVQLGRKRLYTQAPSLLHFPRLPAVAFYPRELFPWLPALEAAADTIRDELLVVLREDTAEMRPYVAHPPGASVGDWAELNHSPRWSAFFLWEHGVKNDARCARCPRTAAVLDAIPMMDCPGYAPTVLFSILSPHTHIPPHSSVTNARLVVHLPLIAPANCRFRVGNDIRAWKSGQAWVFDDTIEHEAWNDSDHLRVIMMIDIWNPFLSVAERDLVSVLLQTEQDWYSASK